MNKISSQKKYSLRISRKDLLDAIFKKYHSKMVLPQEHSISIYCGKGLDEVEISWFGDEEKIDI